MHKTGTNGVNPRESPRIYEIFTVVPDPMATVIPDPYNITTVAPGPLLQYDLYGSMSTSEYIFLISKCSMVGTITLEHSSASYKTQLH